MEWWQAVADSRTEAEAWEVLKECYPEGGTVRILGPVPTEGNPAQVFELTVPAMAYPEYLNSGTWRSIRAAALRGAEYRCQVCNSAHDLQVHHRRYPERGTERWPGDLTVLCNFCHSVHEAFERLRRRLDK